MMALILDGALGSRAKVQILRALARAPRRSVSGNALAKEIGMSPNTVHRALKELVANQIVDVSQGPVAHGVMLKADNELTQVIIRLFKQEGDLRDATIAVLRRTMPEDVVAVLFGSLARGTAGEKSDIDLLVVAPDHDRAVDVSLQARDAVRNVLPWPVRPIHLTPSELRSHWKRPWLRSVREEGIILTRKRLEDFL